MKSPVFLTIAIAAACATTGSLAEQALELEPVDPEPGAWRVSVGFRAAPGIRTSASVDARAAAVAARLPAPGTTRKTSVRTGRTVSATEGTTEADAKEEIGPGYTGARRYEFDGGYIDMDDGAGIEGETQNWHFDDASAFKNGSIVLESRSYGSRTTTESSTTRTVTETTVERRDEVLLDDDDDTAAGIELRLDRTLWEDSDFGVDAGLGFVWYDDIDCFSVAGRACTATRATDKTTETTDFTGLSSDSGTVFLTLSEPEFASLDDILNADGSIGGGYVVGGALPDGWKNPVLTVTADRFGTFTTRNPSLVGAWLSMSRSSSKNTSASTVDVRSEGTLSLRELRMGASPFWKATRWLRVRADAGAVATFAEIETRTAVFADGTRLQTLRRDDDDWRAQGYAGLSMALVPADWLEIAAGAEARFPKRRIHFDDGIVSGSAELASWNAFLSVGVRF